MRPYSFDFAKTPPDRRLCDIQMAMRCNDISAARLCAIALRKNAGTLDLLALCERGARLMLGAPIRRSVHRPTPHLRCLCFDGGPAPCELWGQGLACPRTHRVHSISTVRQSSRLGRAGRRGTRRIRSGAGAAALGRTGAARAPAPYRRARAGAAGGSCKAVTHLVGAGVPAFRLIAGSSGRWRGLRESGRGGEREECCT